MRINLTLKDNTINVMKSVMVTINAMKNVIVKEDKSDAKG